MRAARLVGDARRTPADCGPGGRGGMRDTSADECRAKGRSRAGPPENARDSCASLDVDMDDMPLQKQPPPSGSGAKEKLCDIT